MAIALLETKSSCSFHYLQFNISSKKYLGGKKKTIPISESSAWYLNVLILIGAITLFSSVWRSHLHFMIELPYFCFIYESFFSVL